MSQYVITKKHTFKPANQVYFAYSLGEALDTRDELAKKNGEEWLVAEVVDEKHWLMKLVIKLHRSTNGN